MSAPLRVGVIGCGTIAYWAHLRVLARMREVELVAGADPDSRARDAAAKLVGKPMFERSEELFARRDIDAVVISVPTHLHHVMAIEACAAHKHFYLEKPLAISAEDGHRVLATAAKANVVAMIGFNRRFHPVIEQARAVIAQRRLGRIYAVQSVSSEPHTYTSTQMPEWRKQRAHGGGVMLELASHHIDLIRWLLDDEVARVEARIDSEVTDEDSAWMRLSMRQGTEVSSFFSFRTGLADWIELFGERGSLTIDRSRPTAEFRGARRFGYGARRHRAMPRVANMQWRLMRLARPSFDPSRRRALEHFVRLVRGDSRDEPTLDDGMRSLEVVLAAEKSSRIGQPVSLDGERACASS
ncbi:MAG TPA: Gfo/Idh/MocA family oxidoreductase [Candidatus Binataceae bacterium]|nr:Gfo/Idh/MocA family oxidoreductase [Candidatus Binataceae bacterium]